MLIVFRERRREGESKGEKHGYERETFINCPTWGLNLHTRYAPGSVIEPVTFQCMGWHANQLNHSGNGKGIITCFVMCLPFLVLHSDPVTPVFRRCLPDKPALVSLSKALRYEICQLHDNLRDWTDFNTVKAKLEYSVFGLGHGT